MIIWVVTDLWYLPSPLRWTEDIDISLGEVSTQQQDKAAVPHEKGVVVAVHLCKTIKGLVGHR